MRVAIISPLPSFQGYYSVARCIRDQVMMLERAGHEVTLYVKQGFNDSWGTLPCVSTSVFTPGVQVTDKRAQADAFATRFGKGELGDYHAIFTHDAVFLDSMSGFRDGIREIHESVPGRWFHWSHSVPQRKRGPAWNGIPGHTYISLCEEHVDALCDMYRITPDQVGVIWNPTDASDLFSGPTQRLILDHGLMDCDILAVLPFSTGRLKQKGIQRAVDYYTELARMGYSVKVVLCNALAMGPGLQPKTVFQPIFEKNAAGLPIGILWMSDIRPEWAHHTPNEVIRELQMIANVFIYPTIGEGFSLAIGEALSGGAFLVLPESRVAGMAEIAEGDPDVFLCYWQEGEWQRKKFKEPTVVAKEIATFGPGRLDHFVAKHRRRWRLTRDRIWRDMYLPVLNRFCPGAW